MYFESPLWLVIIPIALLYVWWMARKSYAHLSPWARVAGGVVRGVIIVLLAAALSQPVLRWRAEEGHLVLVIDVSQSVTAENIHAAIEDADRIASGALERGDTSRVSLILFGEHAELIHSEAQTWTQLDEASRELAAHHKTLEALRRQRSGLMTEQDGPRATELDEKITTIERFRERIVGDRTNLERALRLAMNCGSTRRERTVVFFTDANENQGDWSRVIDPDSATVHFVGLDKAGPPEVAIAELAAPSTVRVHQGFSATIRITSTVDTTANLRVYKDGYLVLTDTVQIPAGKSAISLDDLAFEDKGFHTLEVVLDPKNDTKLANNTVRTIVSVPGKARVLYIDGEEDQTPYLKTALELEGIDTDIRPAAGVPHELADLLGYDALILSDVPAELLSRRQMEMIRSYVRDFGGGFVMLGGDESFGLGGYYDTPIEEILPVRMPIQKDLLRPSLAIFLVIDKSGSMAGVKIQLAKRAAIATAEAINPRDQIGVIGFDSEARLVLELTPAADLGTISSKIGQMDAGGGTFLHPALENAHQRLLESNARRKHVIVLSDGQTTGFGYEQLAQSMTADLITVSTIGIGQGADMALMEAIAASGGGRSYFTNDFFSIPQIFTREALRAANQMLVERLVEPVVLEDDPALAGIDAIDLPLLTGYVATTPKSAATIAIVSDSGDPLLARWRYGLGRTVAFTSDTKPRWAEDWIDWMDFAKFWGQLVRSITGSDLSQRITVLCSHRIDDDGVVLIADVQDENGQFVSDLPVTLTTFREGGARVPVEVVGKGPGLYESKPIQIEYGKGQQFSWTLGEVNPTSEADVRAVPYAFITPYSPEFRTLGMDEDAIADAVSLSHGTRFAVGGAEPAIIMGASRLWIVLWPYLLVASLLLIPVDIFIRRIG